MELLVFGHAGARVLVFPTSCGRFFDWENRGMIQALQRHIDNGWVQLYCVDSVDTESWFNRSIGADDRARRHLQYQSYIIQEVLPFTAAKNNNSYVMGAGASFGAYHAVGIALRFPECFRRIIGMSGVYDVREWSDGAMDDLIRQGSPCDYIQSLDNEEQLNRIRAIDFIITIGNEDSLYENNKWLSQEFWNKGIWHALRVWDGFAHDWPQWHEMIQDHIGGPDSRG